MWDREHESQELRARRCQLILQNRGRITHETIDAMFERELEQKKLRLKISKAIDKLSEDDEEGGDIQK
jgi:hypothetical protein